MYGAGTTNLKAYSKPTLKVCTDDVEVNFTHPSDDNAYQNALDEALLSR